MAKRTRTPIPLGLVLIRVVTGAVLVLHGWRWLKAGTLDGVVVRVQVEQALPQVSSWLAWWGESVVLANPDAIAFFWRWGALMIGLSFCAGALTRPAGVLATVFLAHAVVFGTAQQELAFFLLSLSTLVCAASGAGRRLGLDAMFDDHFPGWVTWARNRNTGFLRG